MADDIEDSLFTDGDTDLTLMPIPDPHTPPPEKPSLLVLDVDGVLNTRPGSLDEDKLERLQWIHKLTGCKMLLASSWRKEPRQLNRLLKALVARGLTLTGATPVSDHCPAGGLWRASARWEEIKLWLTARGHYFGNVCILDDEKFMGPLQDLLVNTQSDVGLTDEITDQVIQKLNFKIHG